MRLLHAILWMGLALALSPILPFAAGACAQVLVDDFDDDSIDPALWTIEVHGFGPQVEEVNQELEFFMPAAASGSEFAGRLVSRFLLRGDFDIQADYRLLQWPLYNGVRMAIAIDQYPGMERTSSSAGDYYGQREVYVTDWGNWDITLVNTDDFAGTLRVVRSGATQTGYYRDAGQWIAVDSGLAPTGDVAVQLHAWSHDYAFQDHDVRAACDNFVVNSGQVIYPVPASTTSWGAIKALYR